MQLAKVCGKIVATIKDPSFSGIKLLVIEPVDHDLKPTGARLVAADGVGVGDGEYVMWERAREASTVIPGRVLPCDASIVGKVELPACRAAAARARRG
jgi:ethanolamine utilization protein EutN